MLLVILLNVSLSGCQELDKLENDSRGAKGAKTISEDNKLLALILLPLKKWHSASSKSHGYMKFILTRSNHLVVH